MTYQLYQEAYIRDKTAPYSLRDTTLIQPETATACLPDTPTATDLYAALALLPVAYYGIILSDFNDLAYPDALAQARKTHRLAVVYVTYTLADHLGTTGWTQVAYQGKTRLAHAKDPELNARHATLNRLNRARLYTHCTRMAIPIKWA